MLTWQLVVQVYLITTGPSHTQTTAWLEEAWHLGPGARPPIRRRVTGAEPWREVLSHVPVLRISVEPGCVRHAAPACTSDLAGTPDDMSGARRDE
jgi:hypothetical protein